MAFNPIESVFTDVVGTMKYSSIGVENYFVTLLDQYSRFSIIRLLSDKYEAGEAVRGMI